MWFQLQLLLLTRAKGIRQLCVAIGWRWRLRDCSCLAGLQLAQLLIEVLQRRVAVLAGRIACPGAGLVCRLIQLLALQRGACKERSNSERITDTSSCHSDVR